MNNEYGITPEQYHASLDKLWKAVNKYDNGVDDVFTLCVKTIKELEDKLKQNEVVE